MDSPVEGGGARRAREPAVLGPGIARRARLSALDLRACPVLSPSCRTLRVPSTRSAGRRSPNLPPASRTRPSHLFAKRSSTPGRPPSNPSRRRSRSSRRSARGDRRPGVGRQGKGRRARAPRAVQVVRPGIRAHRAGALRDRRDTSKVRQGPPREGAPAELAQGIVSAAAEPATDRDALVALAQAVHRLGGEHAAGALRITGTRRRPGTSSPVPSSRFL
jgi:hypothetical protein